VLIYFLAEDAARRPQKVRFKMRLDSNNSDWQGIDDLRVAYSGELPPGNHLFQVLGSHDDGLKDANLAYSLLGFFWQTGWFMGIVIPCLCGMLALVVYRLKTRLERRHAAQESFTRQLILSQENERYRVASELHDGLGQHLLLVENRLSIVAEKASPEVASQLLEISKITLQAIGEVRSISHGLRPSALEQVGVTKAIELMVEQIAQTSPGRYSSELHNIDGLLTSDMEINLYRIVQEALNNVIKHSKASEVIVQVAKDPQTITVSVFDNGRGFTPELTASNGKGSQGFGLTNMSQRAKVLGGKLELQSKQGTGTRVTLCVPVSKAAK
jgi:signal transduction histidine kinase